VADLKQNTGICRYCNKPIKKEEIICGYCGYNSQTGTLSPTAKKQPIEEEKKEGGSRSRVMKSIKLIFVIVIFLASISFLVKMFFPGQLDLNGIISKITKVLNPKAKNSQYGSSAKKSTGVSALLKKVFPEKNYAEEQRKTSLKVEGIAFEANSKSIATINGQNVSEGDSIGNIKVEKINETSVELIVNGENRILEIGQSIPLSNK